MSARWLGPGLLALFAATGCERQGILPGQTPSALSTYEPPAQSEPRMGALERQAARADQDATPIAWSSVSLEDTGRVRVARRFGMQRRAGSAEIRAAEEQACSGLAETDRDASPFVHRADIVAVDPIEHGARVRFRHVDGLSADWLDHLVECHLARDEVIGPDGPDTKDSPLAVEGAHVHVGADGTGYFVEVRSDDASAASEIARRAQALRP